MSPKALKHKPGETLGTFTLERALGKGAAAEVWLAMETSDLGFTKRQALKLLRPPPGELEEQKTALLNEARVCGRLQHPGIVDVYRIDSVDDKLFIAMEFVDGPDLNSLLHALRVRNVSVPMGVAIEIAIELSEALEYAHNARDDDGSALGIIHRDLKPSNVLVDRRGILKITDWGLVKSHLNIDATTRGVVKGTPGYIAPEVWGGTRSFKPAADLFAGGAILYEAVMGERLFRGRNLARIAEQVANRDPDDEAAGVSSRCPELVPVLEKLLQRNPEERYSSARQLLAMLRKIREQFPARESFKSFLRELGSLVDEIAPSRQHLVSDPDSGTDLERHADTIAAADKPEAPDRLADPGEDSLWDGELDSDEAVVDGEVAATTSVTEVQEDMASTVPIPIVVSTRDMPGVGKGIPTDSEINPLPEEAEDTLFEGMEEHGGDEHDLPAAEADAAGDPADAATQLQDVVEDDEGDSEDAEITELGVGMGSDPAPPTEPPVEAAAKPEPEPAAEDQPEAAAEPEPEPAAEPEPEPAAEGRAEDESPKARRRRRRRGPPTQDKERLAALVAASIAIGGIALLLTGSGFMVLW